MHKITIVIDGPAGAGKSSVAQAIAQELGYKYLNSGALYRAIALYLHQHHIDPLDAAAITAALPEIHITLVNHTTASDYELLLNGVSVLDQLYSVTIEKLVGTISKLGPVREKVGGVQQDLGKGGGIVADGRDMGSKVFPHAELKVFMTASPAVRAQRRHSTLPPDAGVALEELQRHIEARDEADRTRAISPLVKAPDAVELDTSHMDFNAVVEQILQLAKTRMAG